MRSPPAIVLTQLLCLAVPAGCATPEPLRVEYAAAGATHDSVWFVEERGTQERRQYVVLCHADRTPPCIRVLPRSVRTPEQVREWVDTAPRTGEASVTPARGAARPTTHREPATPPETEVPPGTGRVAIVTPGGWANVYTESGRFLGQTPLSVDFEPGQHILSFRPFGQPVETPPSVAVEVHGGETARVVLSVEGYR